MISSCQTYFILTIARHSLSKAHRLSNPDLTQSPVITSTPDDTFYILKIVLARLLSTGTSSIVQKTCEILRDTMDREYAGVIKKKLDDVYRNAGVPGPGLKGEKVERENRQTFIVRSSTQCYSFPSGPTSFDRFY